jgi:hypothetical protein
MMLNLDELFIHVRQQTMPMRLALEIFQGELIRWALANETSHEAAAKALGTTRRKLAYRIRKGLKGVQDMPQTTGRWGGTPPEGVIEPAGALIVEHPQRPPMIRKEYRRMFADQRGACKICDKPEQVTGRQLGVYYSDVTGHVLGLICHLCNMGLQGFCDNPRLLSRAIEFLLNNKQGDHPVQQARARIGSTPAPMVTSDDGAETIKVLR